MCILCFFVKVFVKAGVVCVFLPKFLWRRVDFVFFRKKFLVKAGGLCVFLSKFL